jgi:hypothetical protein
MDCAHDVLYQSRKTEGGTVGGEDVVTSGTTSTECFTGPELSLLEH